MTKRELNAHQLETLFEEARTAVPPVSEAFLAQIAADAEEAAARARGSRRPLRPSWRMRLRSRWARIEGAGLPGGLVAAGVTGLWIGLAPPGTLPDPALLWQSVQSSEADLTELEAWYGLSAAVTWDWDDG